MAGTTPLDFPGDEMTHEEKTAIVDSLADEMRSLFHDYVNDRLPYDELSFEMFDTLQTLHALATGALVVEYEDDFDEDDSFQVIAVDELPAEQPASQRQRKGKGRDGN